MDEIVKELEEADELIVEAEQKLRSVARELETIAEENADVKARGDIIDGSVSVTVNHRKTVEKLNNELPYPFYAKRDNSEIQIIRLEVKIDDIDKRREIANVKEVVQRIEEEWDKGAPEKAVVHHATKLGFEKEEVWKQVDNLKQKGEVYEPSIGYLRTT